MKKMLLLLALLCTATIQAQNWEINTVHRINSWDSGFIRQYNKVISRTEPYIAVGVPVAMAVASWINHDKQLFKDAVYVALA